jgi:hypothetical protein
VINEGLVEIIGPFPVPPPGDKRQRNDDPGRIGWRVFNTLRRLRVNINLEPCQCTCCIDATSATIDSMNEVQTVRSLDGLLDPFSRCLDDESARRVAAFKVDPKVQARVDVLAEPANEGLLTAEERSEYEAFINAAHVITSESNP